MQEERDSFLGDAVDDQELNSTEDVLFSSVNIRIHGEFSDYPRFAAFDFVVECAGSLEVEGVSESRGQIIVEDGLHVGLLDFDVFGDGVQRLVLDSDVLVGQCLNSLVKFCGSEQRVDHLISDRLMRDRGSPSQLELLLVGELVNGEIEAELQNRRSHFSKIVGQWLWRFNSIWEFSPINWSWLVTSAACDLAFDQLVFVLGKANTCRCLVQSDASSIPKVSLRCKFCIAGITSGEVCSAAHASLVLARHDDSLWVRTFSGRDRSSVDASVCVRVHKESARAGFNTAVSEEVSAGDASLANCAAGGAGLAACNFARNQFALSIGAFSGDGGLVDASVRGSVQQLAADAFFTNGTALGARLAASNSTRNEFALSVGAFSGD